MRFAAKFAFCPALLILVGTAAAQPNPRKEHSNHAKETVWDLSGGVYFDTDGALPNGACFRLSGHVMAPAFFSDLKRIDTDDETYYERGPDRVTTFPNQLDVIFSIRDTPCDPRLNKFSEQPLLTPEMLSTLRLQLFWKQELKMSPVQGAVRVGGTVTPIEPYATDLAKELPHRYEWTFALTVPSRQVPITDSLVFLLVTPGGKLAARVSARL
jgi:hypothetical protein